MPAIAPKPRPLRRAVGAVVIPADRFEAWRALAVQTPGLNEIERGVLDAVAEHFRLLADRGWGLRLSRDRLAHRLDVGPVHIKGAISRLVELGLVGVEKYGDGVRTAIRWPCPGAWLHRWRLRRRSETHGRLPDSALVRHIADHA
jgi:hypothetical protein